MSLPCDVSLPNPGAWVATAAPYSFDFNSFQARLPARPISRNKATGPTAGMTCPDNRTHYRWSPAQCSLPAFSRSDACSLFEERGIRQLLLVGDSLTHQLFVSLTMLLEGEEALGPKRREHQSHSLFDAAASVCGDAVRVSYQRSDLLALMDGGLELNIVSECLPAVLTGVFSTRAVHDADLIILGVGAHLSLVSEGCVHGGCRTSRNATFDSAEWAPHNLNHTLSTLRAHRDHAIGASPASVVVVGPPTPVPSCSLFSGPVDAADALLRSREHTAYYASQWRDSHRLNNAARWLAHKHGATFVDTSLLSYTRPDAAVGAHGVGAHWSSDDRRDGDCLHTCQPGPVDESVRAIVHSLRQRQDLVVRPERPERRWFSRSRDEWLRHGGCVFERTHLTCASAKRPNGTFGVRHVPQETAYCLSVEPWFSGVFRDCMKGGPNGMNAVAYGCRKKRAAHS